MLALYSIGIAQKVGEGEREQSVLVAVAALLAIIRHMHSPLGKRL